VDHQEEVHPEVAVEVAKEEHSEVEVLPSEAVNDLIVTILLIN
jgi:hypothetical protein